MSTAYTADPVVWDHALVAGDTYQPVEVQLLDADGVAIDLTDVEGEVQIRIEPGGALVLEPELVVTDDANGKFTWIADAADTIDLKPGDKYRYSVRLTWLDGTVRTVLEGTVRIRRLVVA